MAPLFLRAMKSDERKNANPMTFMFHHRISYAKTTMNHHNHAVGDCSTANLLEYLRTTMQTMHYHGRYN